MKQATFEPMKLGQPPISEDQEAFQLLLLQPLVIKMESVNESEKKLVTRCPSVLTHTHVVSCNGIQRAICEEADSSSAKQVSQKIFPSLWCLAGIVVIQLCLFKVLSTILPGTILHPCPFPTHTPHQRYTNAKKNLASRQMVLSFLPYSTGNLYESITAR